MKVTVVSRSGREVVKGGIDLKDSAKVADLQEAIHARMCGVPVSFSKRESVGTLSSLR